MTTNYMMSQDQERAIRITALKINGLADDIRSHRESGRDVEPPILDYYAENLFEIEENLKEVFSLDY